MSADRPQSWLRVLLNDVGEIVTGKTPSTKNPDNFGGSIPFIKPADLDNGGYVTRTADTLTDVGAKLVPTIPANSIPVTCIGNLGKVGITNQISATNQQINTVVPSSQVDYRFFYYQLQTLKPWMQEHASATTVTIINKGKFSKAPVALAPLAEQKVIADKLDTLLAQVENTKARLERIPQILKRFRQSVLAAAVSGRINGSDISKWDRAQLIDVITEKPRNGRSPKGVNYETPYRNLTLSATTSGQFLVGNFKYVELDISEDSYLWVKNGDILIQRANTLDYVGISALYRGPDNAYVYPDLMMKCTTNVRATPEFLHLTLLSESTRKYFRDNATGTSGNMPKINQKTVSETPILLPPIAEQTEIVRRVDQLFAHADRIEQQVNNALARVNNLTQSILAKAFRGELTEQWRKDNPELISGENSAEALLERIKAERAAVKPAKKARIKRATV